MDFRYWLEAKEAPTDDAAGAIYKTIKELLPGNWNMKVMNMGPLKIWRYRSFYRATLEVDNLIKKGDHFEVFVSIYAFKKSKEELDREEKRLYPHSIQGSDWANDPSKWDDTTKYDVKKGNPAVEFRVLVRGTNPDINRPKEVPDEEDLKRQPLLKVMSKFPHTEKVGCSDEEHITLRTPYEVVKYIQKVINRWWDRDDDGDDDVYNPTPVPSMPQLVGV